MRNLIITTIALILSSHAIEISSPSSSQHYLRALIRNNRLLLASNEFTAMEEEETKTNNNNKDNISSRHDALRKEDNDNNNYNDISEPPNLIVPPIIIMTRHLYHTIKEFFNASTSSSTKYESNNPYHDNNNNHNLRLGISGKLFCAVQLILMMLQLLSLLLFIISGTVDNAYILFRMTPRLDKFFKYILWLVLGIQLMLACFQMHAHRVGYYNQQKSDVPIMGYYQA